jgi:hypothetical protein
MVVPDSVPVNGGVPTLQGGAFTNLTTLFDAHDSEERGVSAFGKPTDIGSPARQLQLGIRVVF